MIYRHNITQDQPIVNDTDDASDALLRARLRRQSAPQQTARQTVALV